MQSQTKKTLEAILVGGVLVVSLNNAYAVNACTVGAAGTIAGASTTFVKTSFAPKCSANTVVDVADATNSFGVQAGSIKGNQTYGGTTEGGGVSVCSTYTGAMPTITASAATGC